jgi:hypothetical protein
MSIENNYRPSSTVPVPSPFLNFHERHLPIMRGPRPQRTVLWMRVILAKPHYVSLRFCVFLLSFYDNGNRSRPQKRKRRIMLIVILNRFPHGLSGFLSSLPGRVLFSGGFQTLRVWLLSLVALRLPDGHAPTPRPFFHQRRDSLIWKYKILYARLFRGDLSPHPCLNIFWFPAGLCEGIF